MTYAIHSVCVKALNHDIPRERMKKLSSRVSIKVNYAKRVTRRKSLFVGGKKRFLLLTYDSLQVQLRGSNIDDYGEIETQ